MISRLNSQFFVNMGDFKEKLGIPFYHRSPHLENTGCSPAQLSDGMRAVAMTAGCWLWACRMTSLNQHHLEAFHRLAQLKPNVCSTALPIAALTAAPLPTSRWLTWSRGQERPLKCLRGNPPGFRFDGGSTETMVCAGGRRLVNLSYLLTSLAPSGGYPASCYSVVAQGNHGQGKFP